MEDWSPSCSSHTLQARSALYGLIRAYFLHQGVMEVETPILSPASATDPYLSSAKVVSPLGLGDAHWYLQTSPEFPMKRLLASGSGSIFQIAKCFRAGEMGKRHNIEFSMLEWYRLDYSLGDLMQDVIKVVRLALPDLGEPVQLRYRDAFVNHLGVDPFLANDTDLFGIALAKTGFEDASMTRDDILDLLMSHCIEPNLGNDRPLFLVDYPASQASLARTKTDELGNAVASRFELYLNGIEIANGYHELSDAQEQERRFLADNEERVQRGLEPIALDKRLLAALKQGLPECSGVALGLDRLLMLQLGLDNIEEVIAFPAGRC